MPIIKKKSAEEEIYLGLDHGETNIGVSFGRDGLVCPLSIVPSKNQIQAIMDILRIIERLNITTVVLGLPVSVDGTSSKQAIKVRQFAKLFKVYLKGIKLEFQDEFGSTRESIDGAIELGTTKKRRRKTDDLAAAVILERYLDEHKLR